MIAVTSVIVMAFVVCAPLLIDILTAGRYMESVSYAQIVALSTLTSMIYYSASQIIIALGYTKLTLLNKLLSTVLAIALFSFLIDKYRFSGAAWGLVLVNLISAGGIFMLYMISRHGTANIKNR